ncbi:dipeptidase PepE [Flavobacterium alkalisoli]|uniref:dipeptidase E n=1 Tax=Flavobacterium alkalisoli TaxID=2602769 RepID=A0A5B9FMK5_9FLAO|nr:dipeptidase PepE [Flavobacterium alkalisoli]QEE48284.1 dipeptidase PepE [Flavobacterium alkalisoli]
MKKIIIASTSTLHGGGYLDYLTDTLKEHFKSCSSLLFVPYARPGGISHDDYTKKAAEFFSSLNINVKGIHEFENPVEAVQNAEAIFTGGGNTFLLVTQLYQNKVMDAIKTVVEKGTPYLGTSAGSNICGLTMETTNDMPIIYPPSFDTLGLIPFNINPHYLDPIAGSTHMGETRETRIKEFHQFNPQPVLGLREGSWLEVNADIITLRGSLQARLFRQNTEPEEIETGTDLSWLK